MFHRYASLFSWGPGLDVIQTLAMIEISLLRRIKMTVNEMDFDDIVQVTCFLGLCETIDSFYMSNKE